MKDLASLLEALLQESLAAHQSGNLETAEEGYRKILDVNPDHATANHLLGVVAFQAGMAEESLKLIAKAIAIDPGKAIFHCNLGNTLQALGRANEAIASHQKALSLSPELSQSHNSLGYLLQLQGRLQESLACFDKAVAANPAYAEAYSNRGIVLRKLGADEDAAESFRNALEINPDYAEAHNNLGNTLRGMEKLEDAVASYNRAIAIKPDFVEAHCNLGHALKKLGQTEDALVRYRHALKVNPGLEDVRHHIASICGETTDIAPEKYVRGLFDDYAGRFDEHLTNELGYKIPTLMREAVDALADGPDSFAQVLDLGCGTGMVAENFRDLAGEIDGVDLSPKMLEQAGTKGLYANLYLSDVQAFFEGPDVRPTGYDLILSADTFIYIGKLDGIFSAIRRALTDDGLFVFSVEYLEDGDFKLLPSSRYSQSEAYIEKLAEGSGFSVACKTPVVIRIENDVPISGRLFVLRVSV